MDRGCLTDSLYSYIFYENTTIYLKLLTHNDIIIMYINVKEGL